MCLLPNVRKSGVPFVNSYSATVSAMPYFVAPTENNNTPAATIPEVLKKFLLDGLSFIIV